MNYELSEMNRQLIENSTKLDLLLNQINSSSGWKWDWGAPFLGSVFLGLMGYYLANKIGTQRNEINRSEFSLKLFEKRYECYYKMKEIYNKYLSVFDIGKTFITSDKTTTFFRI